jgi:hypothetical protein
VEGMTHLGRRRFRESLEPSRCRSDILAHSGKEWGSLVIFEEPPIDITDVGACAPIVSTVSDLVLKFGMFLL